LTSKKTNEDTDEITFDSTGMMVIEERKRIRTNDHHEEEQDQDNKAPTQPLNFKKKKPGKF
jgi:hypothetical protein